MTLSNSAAPPIAKDKLLASLAGGPGPDETTGITVVTPNIRLAQALAREFDDAQALKGLASWETADILPLSALLRRWYEDALYSELAPQVPLLLTAAQQAALWEDVVRRSDAGAVLLAVPETAALAASAWKSAHAWQLLASLRSADINEDAVAFRDWCGEYSRRCEREHHTDEARLPDLVITHAGHAALRKPKLLVAYGFDILTPQQRALFAALASAGVSVCSSAPSASRAGEARTSRLACAEARDEVRRAAAWARARLDSNPSARIGIVVPDLAGRRKALTRALRVALAPASMLPGNGDGRFGAAPPLPFNISLGEALTTYPLVQAALLVLELAVRETEFGRASLLIRSPFIEAGEAEAAARALLDIELRRRAEPAITLDRLLAVMQAAAVSAPVLTQSLRKLAEFRRSDLFTTRTPSGWAKAMDAALRLVGFPDQGRSLDSAEYQTLKKWHEVVAGFAMLDAVCGKMGYGEALSRLRRLAAETLFQPEVVDAPVQVLGVLESAGIAFDHLWVMGLSDEAWPIHPRPNPFLPLAAQRAARVPEATLEATLALDAAITQGWAGAAGEVVFSHPLMDGDRRLLVSPLIAAMNALDDSPAAAPSHRDLIHTAGKLETITDALAPPLSAGAALRGGTAVITDQSACPFRAFALHRLDARSPESPHAGLDAMERGILVHRVLAKAWQQLKTSGALDATSDGQLDALLAAAAEDAVARVRRDRPATLAGRFAEVERERLARLARAWIAMEREQRSDDYTVVAVEDKRTLVMGPLSLRGKIDRVDELDDGRRLVIDYKSSAKAVSAWLGDRPDEPQLPLYLLASETGASGIAFAQVKAGAQNMKFVALAADDALLPVKKALPEGGWDAQVAEWGRVLERLATQFAAGDAAVQPKKPGATCRNCDVQPLCRIHERIGALEGDETDEEGDDVS
mgnify:CR=1 FL=1